MTLCKVTLREILSLLRGRYSTIEEARRRAVKYGCDMQLFEAFVTKNRSNLLSDKQAGFE